MQTMIQQWGNSLALRIPKAFARQTNVKKGSRVRLVVEKGHGRDASHHREDHPKIAARKSDAG